MSLRFDHLVQNSAPSPATASSFLQAAANFLTEYHSALPSLTPGVKTPSKKWNAPTAAIAAVPPSKAPSLLLSQSKRLKLYKSYQAKFRQAWHDAKPADLVSIQAELHKDADLDAALTTMIHRSLIGECILDCMAMHWAIIKEAPAGVDQVRYQRGGKNGRALMIPRSWLDEVRHPFRSNGSLMVYFLIHILSRTPQVIPTLPAPLRQILFTCCLRTLYAEVCAEEAQGFAEAAYCSLGRNLDSLVMLMLHLAVIDSAACRAVALQHRVRSAAADDVKATFPTIWASIEWLNSKPWQHPSTCCGGKTTASDLPLELELDVVDGFTLSAAALLHSLDLFPPHLISPFQASNLSAILDYFRSKPSILRASELIACAQCGIIKTPDHTTFVRCGACNTIQYCSRPCAKLDWSTNGHRYSCSRLTKEYQVGAMGIGIEEVD